MSARAALHLLAVARRLGVPTYAERSPVLQRHGGDLAGCDQVETAAAVDACANALIMRDARQSPFSENREMRDELRRRINEGAPSAAIPGEEQRMRPSFKLTALADEQARQGFFAALECAFDQATQALARTAGK